MQDDGKPKSRLRFGDDEQADTAQQKSRASPQKGLAQPGDTPVRSRLQLTDAELADPKLEKPLHQVEKAADQLGKAKARIPKRKALAIARATDEATGKITLRLHFEENLKPPSRLMHEVMPLPTGAAHRQVKEAEDENVGLQAAHSTEQNVESSVRFVTNSSRTL